MTMSPRLVELIVDPQDKGPLLYFSTDGFLYNSRLKLRYEVRDDSIPVLLTSDAARVGDVEHGRLLGRLDSVATGTKEDNR